MTCRARLLLKLVYAVFPIPCFFSSACAGGYIELPLPFHISSVDVAADAISNLSFMPRFSTMSFKINSDIGERQILPWQMNSIFIIVLFLLVLPRKALPRLSSRSRQSQNARLCKHIGHFARCFAYFARDFGDFAMFLILL